LPGIDQSLPRRAPPAQLNRSRGRWFCEQAPRLTQFLAGFDGGEAVSEVYKLITRLLARSTSSERLGESERCAELEQFGVVVLRGVDRRVSGGFDHLS
jgi:hypothetical protein